jgi:hypothetical protein
VAAARRSEWAAVGPDGPCCINAAEPCQRSAGRWAGSLSLSLARAHAAGWLATPSVPPPSASRLLKRFCSISSSSCAFDLPCSPRRGACRGHAGTAELALLVGAVCPTTGEGGAGGAGPAVASAPLLCLWTYLVTEHIF